jgi:hypothetical protein
VGGAVALKPTLKTGGEGHENLVVFIENHSVFIENHSVFIKIDRFLFFMIFTIFYTSTNFVVHVV